MCRPGESRDPLISRSDDGTVDPGLRRYDTQKLPVSRPVVAPQEIGAELVEARNADLAHHQVDLAAEDVDRLLYAGQPTGHRAVERPPAEEHDVRAEAQRDQDIGAAPHAAGDHH